jgi:hypothetical protein
VAVPVYLHSFLTSALKEVSGRLNFLSRPLDPQERGPPVTTVWEAGRAPGTVWKFWGTGKPLPSLGIEHRSSHRTDYAVAVPRYSSRWKDNLLIQPMYLYRNIEARSRNHS